MASKAKSHWENWRVPRLKREAKKMGIETKGLKKAELIHAMREKYWSGK